MSCPLLKPSLLRMALHVFAEFSASSVVRMEFGREVFHDGLEPLDASRLAQGEKGRCATSAFHIDLFSGVNAPLTHSMKGLDHFQPFDLDKDPSCNILHNSMFAFLLRMAWSDLIGAIWSAPPCKEYSRLKLRPGGPKALRTERMDGSGAL